MEFINIHTHQYSAQENVLEIVNQYPNEFDETILNYSIGIHPWHINVEDLEAHLQIIAEKLESNNCLALGECGLDKRIETPIDLQIEVFKKQFSLITNIKKPIILHCVAAYKEVIEIKKEMKIANPMVIHGFSKNKQIAKQLLDNGFYLSFGKHLLVDKDLAEVLKYVPNDRFFLETDTKTDQLLAIYNLAAQHKNINLEELKRIVNENFDSVFKNKLA